jgi:adenosine deaminase
VRNLGPELAERAAKLAVLGDDARVVGFGMAGDERRYAPADFARAYDIARDGGLKLTAHAGEFGGAESVREALDRLKLDRIDHGVRAVEDPGLVRRLVAEEVPLAVCPGSNISLGVFPEWGAHSIDRLMKAGVKVNVSTDDPPFFQTSMTDEYANLASAFGYGREELLALSRSGLDAAFCGPEVKTALAARLV